MVSGLLLKATPYAVAVLVGGGWWLSHNRAEQEKGALRERLHVTDSALKVAAARAPKLDSVFVRDTVRLTKRITVTQTLLDTLRMSDTVTLTRRDSVLVFVADSLVRQCRETVESCTAVQANLRERLRLTELRADAYRRLQPSGFQKARSSLTSALVGAAITYLIVRP